MALSPQEIAHKGEKIYNEKYRKGYERDFLGQFVAIDVDTGEAFVAPTATQAIQKAEAGGRHGYLHLVKIGSPGVYSVSYLAPTSGSDRSLL
jgi:hypothetical protein